MSAAEYYSHGSYPPTRASLSSSAMRSELELIEAGFAKLPDLSGNGGKILAVNAGATALEAVTTTGTGSAVRATSPTLTTPILGTPTSGTLTNCTGLPVASGISGLAAGVAAFLGTPSSANLRSALTDETGSGAAVFGTAPTISAAVLAGTTDLSGGQIKFPAAQSASADANTLDDYEEGTFTPVLQFGGAAAGMTYTVQSGIYTKIGRLVHFRVTIQLSAKGSSTGTALITGLPFTAATGTGYHAFSFVVSNMASITAQMSAYVADNATTINLAQGTNSLAVLTDANFQNNSLLMITGSYVV